MTNLQDDLKDIRKDSLQESLKELHWVICQEGEPHEWGHAKWVERLMLWVNWSYTTERTLCRWFTPGNMRAFSKYLREDAYELPF